MNHEEIKNNLFAHDSELSDKSRLELSAHLNICIECQQTVAAWEKTSAVLFKNQPAAVPSDFVQNVMARIDRLETVQESRHSFGLSALNRWLFPVFASTALAGFVFVVASAPADELDGDVETLLMTQKTESFPSEWLSSYDSPKEGQILNYVTGDL